MTPAPLPLGSQIIIAELDGVVLENVSSLLSCLQHLITVEDKFQVGKRGGASCSMCV